MHDLILMKVGNSLAHLPKVSFYLFFSRFFITNFFEEGTSICVFQYHVGYLTLFVDEIP